MKDKIKIAFKIIIIITLFACIKLTNATPRKVTILEELVSDLVTLPQRAIVYGRHFFGENKNTFFKNLEELQKENDLLKQENQALKTDMIDYEVVVAENKNLKSHIELGESYQEYKVETADVIMTSSSNWNWVYTINKGQKDGIEPKQVVICKEGLVGYVESVTAYTAKVISILDAGNAVSGRITRTRDTAVIKGNLDLAKNNQMRMVNIPVGVTLIEEDKIETSGIGGIYPKGLVIGRVKSFIQKNNPIENEAIVESYVNFEKLETVAVICGINNVEEK